MYYLFKAGLVTEGVERGHGEAGLEGGDVRVVRSVGEVRAMREIREGNWHFVYAINRKSKPLKKRF